MRKHTIPSLLALTLATAALVFGQDVVAPTPETAGNTIRGEDVAGGKYNIIQSFEFGYRFRAVDGDYGKYESDVNYRNGLRLFSSYLSMNSKDGHGKYFDDLTLTTQGLGNDPYESVTMRLAKNGWYRYDMQWRLTDYLNPGLITADALHPENFQRRWQDHDVTLFPQKHLRFMLGYGHSKEDGSSFTSINLFQNQRGDIFSLFGNVRREYNSYRVGGTYSNNGFSFTLLRRWEFYKEDTPYTLGGSPLGLNPTDATTLTTYQRGNPMHGRTPSWLAQLMAERKWIAANGRFSYAEGNGSFVSGENEIGTGLAGAQNTLVYTYGTARRPVVLGDVNITLMPTSRISVVNSTSVSNQRIDGNNTFNQFDFGTFTTSSLNFQFLGIRRIINTTDAHVRVTKKFDFFTGYHYSNREIRSIQSVTDPATPFMNTLTTQENHTYSGVVGFNWTVFAPLRIHAEAEIGSNDNPFYPISEKDYHALDIRAQYRKKNITATAGYRQNNNDNSISLTSYSSNSHSFYSNAAWTHKDWLTFDVGYSHLHTDSLGGIVYFAGSPRATLQQNTSLYVSNIHAANVGVRIAIQKRAVVYFGYNITQDTGDGRSALANTGNAVADLFTNVQTFPLRYQTPLVRLTVPFSQKLKWNFGYQYYGYREDFGLLGNLQNYTAHTGYTSLLWAF